MANPHDFIPGVTDQGPPRAAPNIWPYPGHGTLADHRHAPESIYGLQELAAQIFGVPVPRLLGKCRSDRLARARFALMLVYFEMGWSYPRIANAVGRSDHKTAIHGVKRAIEICQTNAFFNSAVCRLRNAVSPEDYQRNRSSLRRTG